MRTVSLLVVCLLSTGALADPPPEDIQAIFMKMRAGGRPTTEEQARLREWMSRSQGGGASAAMPDDVAAIQARAQQGIPPTPAERERLRAWAAEAKGSLQGLPQREADLRSATPPPGVDRGPYSGNPFMDTDVTVTQRVDVSGPCDDPQKGRSRATQTLSGRFHVRLRTVAPGQAVSFTAQPPTDGPWRLMVMDLGGAMLTQTADGYDCQQATHGATTSAAHLPMTEFAFGAANRPLVNTVLLTPSPDVAHPNSPWSQPGYPQAFRDAALGATLTLDGEALRRQLLAKNLKPFTATHTSTLTADGATTTTVTTWTFGPEKKSSKLKIFVVDKDGADASDAWKKWVPTAWLEDDADAKALGVPVKDERAVVHLLLKYDDGAAGKLKVSLASVSKHPGFAGNYPQTGGGSLPDLELTAPDSEKGWVVADDGQSATLNRAVQMARLDVRSRDFASFGKLTVTNPDDGAVGIDVISGDQLFHIPFDENSNDLADQWEKDEGIFERNWASTVDLDDTPGELAHHRGDGVGVFEEYRGFIAYQLGQEEADARWRRFSPVKMEVFISDQTKNARSKTALRQGLPHFQTASGLTVWQVPEKYLRALSNRRWPSWLNFNTPADQDPHHHPSTTGSGPAAVAIPFSDQGVPDKAEYDKDDKSFHCVYASTVEAPGTTRSATEMTRAPIDVLVVAMYPLAGLGCAAETAKFDYFTAKDWWTPACNGFLKVRKLTPAAFSAAVTANTTASMLEMLTLSTMHEFSHAFGVHHHYETGAGRSAEFRSGALRCPTRYVDGDERWDFTLRLLEWRPSKGAWVPPSFTGHDLDYVRLVGADVTPAWLADYTSDLAAPRGDHHVPWSFCARCRGMMHLWAKDGDRYPDIPPGR